MSLDYNDSDSDEDDNVDHSEFSNTKLEYKILSLS